MSTEKKIFVKIKPDAVGFYRQSMMNEGLDPHSAFEIETPAIEEHAKDHYIIKNTHYYLKKEDCDYFEGENKYTYNPTITGLKDALEELAKEPLVGVTEHKDKTGLPISISLGNTCPQCKEGQVSGNGKCSNCSFDSIAQREGDTIKIEKKSSDTLVGVKEQEEKKDKFTIDISKNTVLYFYDKESGGTIQRHDILGSDILSFLNNGVKNKKEDFKWEELEEPFYKGIYVNNPLLSPEENEQKRKDFELNSEIEWYHRVIRRWKDAAISARKELEKKSEPIPENVVKLKIIPREILSNNHILGKLNEHGLTETVLKCMNEFMIHGFTVSGKFDKRMSSYEEPKTKSEFEVRDWIKENEELFGFDHNTKLAILAFFGWVKSR